MQKLFAGTFFLFNFIFCNFSYAQDLPKYFGVEFQISRGSKTLIKSNIITVEGAPGRLTAHDANGVVHKFDFELS